MNSIHVWAKQRQGGFTIVELLVVIVVIAILASISVVAYTGIQARANDARMKLGVSQLESAISIWTIEHPAPIRGGSNSTAVASNGVCSDGDSGWIASGVSYVCSIEDALVQAGNLPSGFIRKLPNNPYLSATDGRYATMLYSCGTNRYAYYWSLRSPSAAETTNFDSMRTTCGHGVDIRDNYGMRAGKLLQF